MVYAAIPQTYIPKIRVVNTNPKIKSLYKSACYGMSTQGALWCGKTGAFLPNLGTQLFLETSKGNPPVEPASIFEQFVLEKKHT